MKLPETVTARLRAWDEAFVPLAAQRIRAFMAAADQRWSSLRSRARELDAADLDARLAGRWPISLVRELPQVGFILIAALFIAGTTAAVVLHPATTRVVPSPSPFLGGLADGSGPVTLGPQVGSTTNDYRATADRSLAEATRDGNSRLALVSFSAYRTPAQVQVMLAGVTVRRVYLRSPAGGRDAAQRPVDIHGGLVADLRHAYAIAVLASLEAHRSYQTYVDTTNNDKPYQRLYAAFAASTALEARAYQGGCACVFAAVVEAKAPQLIGLRARQGVRDVEATTRSISLRELLVLPLLPEVHGPVPRAQTPGDPSH